jgi:hypothetical protein
MERISKTNRHLLLLIVLDVTLMLISIFLIFDLQENRLVEVDRLNLELTSQQVTKVRANSIDRVVKDSREERDRLNFYFITKETTANFVEELEATARRSGVIFNLGSLNVVRDLKVISPIPGQGKISYLRSSFRFDGSFSDVFRFIKVLEKLPYQVVLSSISMKRLETEDVVTPSKNIIAPWYGEVTMDLVSYIDK